MRLNACAALLVAAFLAGCAAPPPYERPLSQGHLSNQAPPVVEERIPEPVRARPVVPLPKPSGPTETYTVVVNDVPVKELLFALARDAQVNVDVHPDVTGNITLNAIDQTLYQILDRISRQTDIRYEDRDGVIVIGPDRPFLRSYTVDYVNLSRDTSTEVKTSTKVATTGQSPVGGETSSTGNESSSTITNESNNRLWETMEANIREIVRPEKLPLDETLDTELETVLMNKESGVIVVRATARKHQEVQRYLDQVAASISRQVLIEATIVEVELNDRYQAGINWNVFTRDGGTTGAGLSLGQDVADSFISGASGAVSGLLFNLANAATNSPKRNVAVSIRALSEFGDVKVLSSPKVMTLNNQPAVLKVVDNEVYFTVDVEITEASNNNPQRTTVESQVNVVPVGLILNVTPQVSQSDTVTLNVRPTITRVRNFVSDPTLPLTLALNNINVTADPTLSQVPVVQVRETETVMRIGTGQLAILGGLMQDRVEKGDEGIPGLKDISGLGELFKFRDRQQVKTELVIFIRPSVIRSPDVEGDLQQFANLLPTNLPRHEALPSAPPDFGLQDEGTAPRQ
ncbi:MAG: type II and III secretion system protein [Gammaproteobacteria bacterium]|nr:type II and III secretion system protein [Gammaproteobacteria bacterium]